MSFKIKKAAVLGAGVMGAGIAAHQPGWPDNSRRAAGTKQPRRRGTRSGLPELTAV